ncbi:hypothetical protein QBC47DRAFT_78574 [Echria macrotheca]|uniref:ADF-H domain-containing protein n=1 Tax=Echria macrotheca TaxID=438768 RepID=A0AAJ0F365_9PEZI|nr:hypothetical protein QBC47DRAFT_78574 [Echria macrotheca]
MSLNGLDDVKVKEAHDAAVAEPGGWFLLKYASRDEVELLDRGNGGVVEIRNAVAQYEEKSPLYGFLRYRRRNVIIKYLPEDCSRLVQARVTVHFNSVCDRFSPFDTSFSISEAKELKDTKLSAACSLHAASGSTSSSTSSLRRRRLVEIAEEEEDEERDRKRQSVVKEDEQPVKEGETSPPPTLNANLASSPDGSKFVEDLEPPNFTGVPRPPSPAKSFDDAGRRMSSQSARPDLYSSSYLYGKPRVKLAPRPSADLSGRPRTSAGNPTFRPVSSIPAGLKLSKTPKKGRKDQDDDMLESPIKEEAETPFSSVSSPGAELVPPSAEPARPHTSGGPQPELSRAPSFKANIPTMPPPPTKQNTMTPEKQRLLKAMKLREKKKQMYLQPTPDVPTVELSSAPSTPGLAEEALDGERLGEAQEKDDAAGENDNLLSDNLSIARTDSAIGIDRTDQASVDTHSDSHPTSPLANSDIGDSTQASSLSESTDETVHAAKESALQLPHDGNNDDAASISSDEDERSVPEVLVADMDEKVENTESEIDHEQDIDTISSPAVPPEAVGEETAPAVTSIPALSPSVPSTGVEAEDEVADDVRTEPDVKAEEAPSSPTDLAESVSEEPPQIHIPVSKFSTRENKSPSSVANATIPMIASPGDGAGHEDGSRTEVDASDAASVETGRSRRRADLEIRTDLKLAENDKRHSMVSLSDDDGLMDELQSATVQQAKPIMVSKTPKSPTLPTESNAKRLAAGLESGSTSPRIVRTVSNPVRGKLLTPGDVSTSSARTVSSGAAFLHKITQQPSSAELKPKSGKIGSSISQRIKALEKLSSSSTTGDTPSKDRPAATFFSVRKPSGREPSRSPSVADRANSLTRGGPTPSPPDSGESSPESAKISLRDRNRGMVSRLSMFEGGKPPRGRPESIQVTARIIRDPGQKFPKVPEVKTDPADFEPLDLKQSPLLVDVQKRSHSPSPLRTSTAVVEPAPAEQEAQPEKQSLLQRRFSKERRSQSQDRHEQAVHDSDKEVFDGPRPRRRSSLTVVKDFIKDRRESLLGAKSPSTDNLGLSLSMGGLSSPALPTPSKSPRPPSVHQNSIFPRRLSISSRRSSIEQSSPPAALSSTNLTAAGLSPPPRTAEGNESEGDVGSVSGLGDKKSSGSGGSNSGSTATSPTPGKSSSSRATRFMRRLSNSLSSSRKNVTPSISPTVAEEEDAEVEAAGMGIPQSSGSGATGGSSYLQPTIVSYMGDVNVQFPDNLLWKRRTICLDSQGFLILSAVQGGTSAAVPLSVQSKDRHHQAGAIKRYHMCDFKPPYTPEMEVQELPNSVVLDFVDGSGLQIACEDRAGQMNVLHVLQEAHHNHTNFGQ